MEPRVLAGDDCGKNDCPRVVQVDRDTVAVQGRSLSAAGTFSPAHGEGMVQIPLTMLLEAARAAR